MDHDENSARRIPKVSVCVVAYNHENYIGQCLQSLVEQDFDFDFEIIVGDDCSSDGTLRIVEDYVSRYPGMIKCLAHSKNVGACDNYILVHGQANGEYVAHMDGDDYALPGKLRSQVKYMDENPGCSMVFHRCLSLHQDGSLKGASGRLEVEGSCEFAEFLFRYPSASWHSAKMYRRSAGIKRDCGGEKFIDKHLHFEHGLNGLVGFINKDLAVYRVGVGVSSNIYETQRLALNSYEYAIQLGYDKKLMAKIIARECFEQGLRALLINDRGSFQNNVKLGFKSGYRTPRSLLAYCLMSWPGFYLYVRDWMRGARRRLGEYALCL